MRCIHQRGDVEGGVIFVGEPNFLTDSFIHSANITIYLNLILKREMEFSLPSDHFGGPSFHSDPAKLPQKDVPKVSQSEAPGEGRGHWRASALNSVQCPRSRLILCPWTYPITKQTRVSSESSVWPLLYKNPLFPLQQILD